MSGREYSELRAVTGGHYRPERSWFNTRGEWDPPEPSEDDIYQWELEQEELEAEAEAEAAAAENDPEEETGQTASV